MTANRIILVLVAVLAIAVSAYLAYDNVLRGDSIAPLALPSAAPSSTGASSVAATGSVASNDSVASASSGTTTGGALAGTWSVSSGEAGYRVRERLANLPAESDAVGRTSAVTGAITIADGNSSVQLTGGTISVVTTQIASNESRRDNRLRTEGLQTDLFPTASFKLTSPVAIPAAALQGTPTNVTLVGDLTLHGVTKSVEIPAQAQLANGTISVAGSLRFPLSDFDITAPNVGGFILSIANTGTLEFSVGFTKS
ncbi:MAG: YceI family protein [Chloroflexota bacterium]